MITLTKNTKEIIKEKAEELFRNNGYPATSMRELAKASGLEPASIYSHFRSKEEILKTICYEITGKFFKNALPIAEQDHSATEKLRLLIKAHLEIIIDNIDAVAVFFHDWRHLSEENLANFRFQRSKYEQIFKNTIHQGIENGEFSYADEKFISLMLFSSMNWTYEWYKPNGKMRIDEIAENIFDIILQGIKNKNK